MTLYARCVVLVLGLLVVGSSADSCLMTDINMPGFDIRQLVTQSASECQTTCKLEVSCYYFTYVVADKKCWLKQDGAEDGAYPISGQISGPKSCGGDTTTVMPTSMPGPSCLMTDINMPGFDIRQVVTQSASECQTACKLEVLCYYFTYVVADKKCWLKQDGAEDGAYPISGQISGPKSCDESTTTAIPITSTDTPISITTSLPPSGCALANVNIIGYDVGLTFDRVSPDDCQAACLAVPQCSFFSYFASSNACYLKSSASAGSYSPANGYYSGPRVCPTTSTTTSPSTAAASSCAVQNSNYPGNDISLSFGPPTPDACQALCQQDIQCSFFSYYAATTACYLKAAAADGTQQASVGYWSGPKECTSLSTTSPAVSCAVAATQYPGNDVGLVFDRNSPDTCQAACQAHAACFFFSYVDSTSACYLKSAAASGTSMPSPGYSSGPKYCPVAPPKYCGYPNIDILGAYFTKVPGVPTPQACQAACVANTDCGIFVYNKVIQVCYLKKDSDTGTWNPNTSYESGLRSC